MADMGVSLGWVPGKIKYRRSAMGNATGNTMQAIATAREKAWRQEQWRTVEKTGEEKNGNRARAHPLPIGPPQNKTPDAGSAGRRSK
jgi:hypothetical protein